MRFYIRSFQRKGAPQVFLREVLAGKWIISLLVNTSARCVSSRGERCDSARQGAQGKRQAPVIQYTGMLNLRNEPEATLAN